MGAIASQITSLTIVYSTIYSDADHRKHQSSASLAFVWGIHRGPVNSSHKWPVTRKMFPYDDVIMMTKFNLLFIIERDPMCPLNTYTLFSLYVIADPTPSMDAQDIDSRNNNTYTLGTFIGLYYQIPSWRLPPEKPLIVGGIIFSWSPTQTPLTFKIYVMLELNK